MGVGREAQHTLSPFSSYSYGPKQAFFFPLHIARTWNPPRLFAKGTVSIAQVYMTYIHIQVLTNYNEKVRKFSKMTVTHPQKCHPNFNFSEKRHLILQQCNVLLKHKKQYCIKSATVGTEMTDLHWKLFECVAGVCPLCLNRKESNAIFQNLFRKQKVLKW